MKEKEENQKAVVAKAASAIIFHGNKFLLLKKKGTWTGWQFVQGKQEKDEAIEEACLREAEEETGIGKEKLKILKKLDYSHDYWFRRDGKLIHKFLTFFLVEAPFTDDIRLSREHSDFKWMEYEEARNSLKFNKDIFEKAYKELQEVKSYG